MSGSTLTEEQIRNWRQVLLGMVGPYALLMTTEQIQELRDQCLARADALARLKGRE